MSETYRQSIDLFNEEIAESGPPLNNRVVDRITATAEDINKLRGMTASREQLNRLNSPTEYIGIPKISKVELNAVDTPGGLFVFTPGVDCIILRVVLHITNPSGFCVIAVGSVPTILANTGFGDDLIDNLVIDESDGSFDNIQNRGTSGRASVVILSDTSVTGTVVNGTSEGLVGSAYIHWVES